MFQNLYVNVNYKSIQQKNKRNKKTKPNYFYTAKRSPNAKDGRTPEEIRKLIDR